MAMAACRRSGIDQLLMLVPSIEQNFDLSRSKAPPGQSLGFRKGKEKHQQANVPPQTCPTEPPSAMIVAGKPAASAAQLNHRIKRSGSGP